MAKRKRARPRSQGHEPSRSAARPAAMPGGGFLRYTGILAAILGVCLYANTLGHDYCLDDHGTIADNYLVKGGLENISTFFLTEFRYGVQSHHRIGPLYRPLTLTIFTGLWQLAPDSPGFYHGVNVLLYALTGWLLWAVWRRILWQYPPLLPALGVLLFMAHPVHTEVVANIKSMDEILALLFCTAALYGLWRYERERRSMWLAGGVAAYGLGLLCKEGAIVFLGLFPLVLWFFTKRRLIEILRISSWFLLPTVLFLAARHQALARQGEELSVSAMTNFIVLAPDMLSRLATALAMCWRYLEVLLLPHPLVSILGYPQLQPVTFADWRSLAGLLLYGGAGIWALWASRHRLYPAFAVLFFLISFSLVSNTFYLVHTAYAERTLYLPSLGFVFGLSWGLMTLVRLLPEKRRQPVLLALVGIILALYTVKTVSRNRDWEDDYRLLAADIQVAHDSALLQKLYGIQCLKRGFDETTGTVHDPEFVKKSIALFSSAIQAFPYTYETIGWRASAYERLGEYGQASADYEKAIELNPQDTRALSALASLYSKHLDRFDKAEKLYRRAIAADPRFMAARGNLGITLARQGRYAEAIEQWREALKYAPDNWRLHQFIGQAYTDMGQPDQGRPFLEKASRLRK